MLRGVDYQCLLNNFDLMNHNDERSSAVEDNFDGGQWDNC